jgi:hypothetical protein
MIFHCQFRIKFVYSDYSEAINAARQSIPAI